MADNVPSGARKAFGDFAPAFVDRTDDVRIPGDAIIAAAR